MAKIGDPIPGQFNERGEQLFYEETDIANLTSAPPTDAGGINNLPEPKIPSISPTAPDTTDVSGMLSFYKSQFDTLQKQQGDTQRQAEEQRKLQAEQTKPFLDKILGSKSAQDIHKTALAQTGIDPQQYFTEQKAKLAEIDTLNTEYNRIVAARDQQIAGLYGQGRGQTIDFLNNQEAQIMRNAAPRLNMLAANIQAKASIMEASQGRFKEAQAFADKAVDYATADLKFNLDTLKTFYDMNQTIIDRLDTKYQNAFKNSITIAQNAYDNARTAKQQEFDNAIKEAQLKKPDTFGSAETGYHQTVYNPKTGQYETRPVAGGGGATGDPKDSLQKAIDAGMTPEDAALDVATYWESIGIQVDKKTINSWTQTARGLKKTPTPAAEVPQPKTAVERGRATRSTIGFFPQALKQVVTKPISAVGSFFSGLFGE